MIHTSVPDDVAKVRQQALKLTKHGSLEGRYPVKVDKRTTVYKKICTEGKNFAP